MGLLIGLDIFELFEGDGSGCETSSYKVRILELGDGLSIEFRLQLFENISEF